ncbi:MAG TPA: hypothetical protein PK961_09550 [bacterium]|nr:hypothetical protein [bacterium]
MPKEIYCRNCGEPLKIRPDDIVNDKATCGNCGEELIFSENEELLGVPYQMVKTISKHFYKKDEEEEVDENAEPVRPSFSRIELEDRPGTLILRLPPRGFKPGDIFLSFFVVVWCSFMIMWNVIGLVMGEWMMLVFGLFHDAIGLGLLTLLLWSWYGREEIAILGDTLTQKLTVFGIGRKKTFPLSQVDDVEIASVGRVNNLPVKGLFLMLGSKKKRIARNAAYAEIRWLRAELLKFFQPLW